MDVDAYACNIVKQLSYFSFKSITAILFFFILQLITNQSANILIADEKAIQVGGSTKIQENCIMKTNETTLIILKYFDKESKLLKEKIRQDIRDSKETTR